MKTVLNFYILILSVGAMSCQDFNMNDTLSDDDLKAADGMEQAFKIASLYNDSLNWCLQTNPDCTEVLAVYYDKQFHQQDDLFEKHNNTYSIHGDDSSTKKHPMKHCKDKDVDPEYIKTHMQEIEKLMSQLRVSHGSAYTNE
jgi:hypothetical protein